MLALATNLRACRPADRAPHRPRTKVHHVLLALAILLAAGCATPGPLHLYTLAAPDTDVIHDRSAPPAAQPDTTVPSFLEADERAIGFAYDPYTDHFFLRLSPGDLIRVVDRPARAIKREFRVAELADPATPSDLAIRPRDGHVFAPHPRDSALVEFTRLGKYVRTIPLAGYSNPPAGVAIDPQGERVFTLRGTPLRTTLQTHTLAGERLAEILLPRAAPGQLAYDPETHEVYALLADGSGVGVFSESGKLLRTFAISGRFIDIGPRSFIRVF